MRKDRIDLCLAGMQGRLFENWRKYNFYSEIFIEVFMNSDIAKDLDSKISIKKLADDKIIMKKFLGSSKKKLSTIGHSFDEEILYWIGYVYRYWNILTGESSKDIYKKAPVRLMGRKIWWISSCGYRRRNWHFKKIIFLWWLEQL